MTKLERSTHFRRARVGGSTTTTATTTPATTTTQALTPGQQQPGKVDVVDQKPVVLDADVRLRTSSIAAAAGPTTTAVPDLVADWKKALVEAAAQEAARKEMWPDVDVVLKNAEKQTGAPLEDDHRDKIVDDFFEQHSRRFKNLTQTYEKDFGKSAKSIERTVQQVVAGERPRIAQRRDPFTPLSQKDPAARAKELVLWESAQAMVIVDLFAPVPKALVVPKQQVMLPLDAPKKLLDDVALLAAHVSDALSTAHGTPPAGIWVNPPQDVTVRQLHVHVMADVPHWQAIIGAKNAKDPALRPQVEGFFAGVARALEQKLGPSS